MLYEKVKSSGRAQFYPIRESDCYTYTYLNYDGSMMSDRECEEVRERYLSKYFKFS